VGQTSTLAEFNTSPVGTKGATTRVFKKKKTMMISDDQRGVKYYAMQIIAA
jgi:hypothetical protein